MDVGRIFSRSLELTWRYKFLWLYGLIMGLTSGGGGGNGGGNFNFGGNDLDRNPFAQGAPPIDPAVIVLLLAVACVIVLVWLVLTFYFRFVARGAMVVTVREVEERGSATLRETWSEGQKFYTRLLGLGFLVNVPLALISIVLIAAALSPLLIVLITQGARGFADERAAGLVGAAILSVAAICCVALLLIIASLVIHPLYEFAVRAIVLEDMRVIEGWRHGVQRVRENLNSLLGLYLLLMGARLGWAVVTAILAIPIVIVILIAALGALQFGIGAVIALVLVLAIPAILLFGFIEGLFQVFESNAWTEAYLTLLQRQSQVAP